MSEKRRSPSPPPYPSSSTHPAAADPDSDVPLLKSTSHYLTLSLPRRPYEIGSSIPLTLTPSVLRIGIVGGEVVCSLEGRTEVTVMGKQRWQAAQMVNAATPGGSGVLITTQEKHIFVSSSLALSLPSESSSAPAKPTKLNPDADASIHTWTVHLPIPEQKTCSCGGAPMGSLDNATELDHVPGKVEWKLRVGAKRKGFLRRDYRISIPIEVREPPRPVRTEPETVTASQQLSLTPLPGSPTPTLLSTLTLLPPSPSSPHTLHFTLTLSSSTPTLLPPLSPPSPGTPKLSISVSRMVWTVGIDHPGNGDKDGFDWVGVRVCGVGQGTGVGVAQGKGVRGSLEVDGDGGRGWKGWLEVKEKEKTVVGCGLANTYALHAVVTWGRLKHPLAVSLPLFLPS